MSITRRHRLIAAVGSLAALLAPLGVVAAQESASAKAPKRHIVGVYKVEQHLTLEGEYPDNEKDVIVTCDAGDIAVDGMWRVDHVDQQQPDPEFEDFENGVGDERHIFVKASYGTNDNTKLREWNFSFVNGTGAIAQLKMFVVCVKGTTSNAHGHTHALLATAESPTSFTGAGVANPKHATAKCDPGEIAVAPGFRFTKGSGHVQGSWPEPNHPTTHDKWQWQIKDLAGSPEIDIYVRCLSERTSKAGPSGKEHDHKLYLYWLNEADSQHVDNKGTVPVGETEEVQRSCDDWGKAIVGSYWTSDSAKTWFLGMDPRPKTRAFRWWNSGAGPATIHHSVLCLKTRTSGQLQPPPPPGP